jgi:hypothetical protein
LMPNYGTKRLTNGKKERFRSKLPVEAKWITTDEIIAFEQKIEAKVQLAVDGSGKLGAYSRIDEIHLQ